MKVQLDTANRGSVLVATLHGELDHHTAEIVRETIDERLNVLRPSVLVLDLSGLTFMDSSGLGVVLGRYRKIKAAHGEMIMTSVPTAVAKLFELSGMHKIMRIYPSRKDAIDALKEVSK